MTKKTKIIYIAVVVLFSLLFLINLRSDKRQYLDAKTFALQAGSFDDLSGSASIGEESGYEGYFARTPELNLKKGAYTIRTYYRADHDYSTMIAANYDQILYGTLDPSRNEVETVIRLERDTDVFKMQYYYDGRGDLSITGFEIIGDKVLYTDTVYFVALFLILAAALYILIEKGFFRNLGAEGRVVVVVLAALFIYVNLPLYNDYLIEGIDSYFHITRIEGIKDALLSGSFPAYIYPQANNEYGVLGALYPDLFLYIPAALRLMQVSMATAYKTLLALVNLATILAAYCAVKSICRSDRAALFGAAVYCLLPYRMTNLYIRGALGEALAMVFLPLAIAGLYHVAAGDKKKWPLLLLAYTGILNSHIISCLLVGGVSLFVAAVHLPRILREKRVLPFLKTLLCTLILNLGFLTPFFYYYFLGSKTNIKSLANPRFYQHALFPQQLFMSRSNIGLSLEKSEGIAHEMSLSLGLLGALCVAVILVIYLFGRPKDGHRDAYTFTFSLTAAGFVSALAGTTLFPWQQLQKLPVVGTVAANIQFPFRFLSIASVLIILSASVLLASAEFPGCPSPWGPVGLKPLFLPTALALSAVTAFNIIDACALSDIGYRKAEGNVRRTVYTEYLPLGEDENSFSTNSLALPDENAVETVRYQKAGNRITLTYTCKDSQGAYADLPLFYYDGYRARRSDGVFIPIGPGEHSRIRLPLQETADPVTVEIFFGGFWFFKAGVAVSLAAALAGLWALFYRLRKKRREPV